MLSQQDERAWDDIQRHWAESAEEPAAVRRAAASLRRRTRRERAAVPGWVVAGTWVAIYTVLFGAVAAGLALAAATFLGWALWHYWPRPAGRCGALPVLVAADGGAGDAAAAPTTDRHVPVGASSSPGFGP